LKERIVGNVTLHEGRTVVEMRAVNGKVEAILSDGVTLTVDHVVMGTGYKIDVQRLEMIDPSLRAEINTDAGAPILSPWFESSVPGLYFVGLTSLRTFGPLFRFVAGCKAAAPRVASSIARKAETSKQTAARAVIENVTARVTS
jgi:hypothetical protein